MQHDNAELARRWFEEVWNKARPEAIDEMLDPNAVAHGLGDGGGDVRGVEAFKAVQRQFTSAFPDLRVEVDDVVTDGDRTAIRFTCTGTHRGDTLGVAATGRRVTFTGMAIARWKDGRIIEGWNNIDFGTMMQQIQA